MRLEWFRSHKTFVYWLLLPMVVISFVIYGNVGSRKGGSIFGDVGPRLEIVVGDKTIYMSPSEVIQKRLALWHFDQGGQPTTDQVGYRVAALELARQLGLNVGPEEEKEMLKQTIEYKIMMYDRGTEAKASKENYNKLLTTFEMTADQFVERVHEDAVLTKLYRNLNANMIASDTQLFPQYCEENESLRIRYKVFKSPDYLAQTKKPEDTAIKNYYDENTKNPNEKDKLRELDNIPDVLLAPMNMSVEALGYKNPKELEVPAPTEAELKQEYDQWKSNFWKEPSPTPPTAPEPGKPLPEDKFKPFDTVKADVEKHWREAKKSALKSAVILRMGTLMTDLAAEEKKFKEDKANAGKEFDLAAWAKKHDVTIWVTPEQPEEKYKEGKNEMNAPDIKQAMSLWFYSSKKDARGQKRTPADLEAFRKKMYDFTSFAWFDFDKPELGGAWVRAKKFNDERLKSLEEAKDAIIEQLRSTEARQLASEAAKKAHDEWQKGDNLPKLADLEEVTSDSKKDHPLINGFKRSPKVIGDVLDVESGLPEDLEKDAKFKSNAYWYYVGTCVERKLPDWNKYMLAKDADFSRSSHRRQESELDYFSAQGLLDQRIKDNVHKFATGGQEGDVPLGEVVKNAQSDR